MPAYRDEQRSLDSSQREPKIFRIESKLLRDVLSWLHPQNVTLFTLLLVGGVCVDVSAQSVSLSLPTVEATIGSSVAIPMLVSNDHAIDAISIGVQHRSSNIALSSVTQGMALTSLNEPGSSNAIPAFFDVQINPTLPTSDPSIVGGFTVGILVDLDLLQPTRLPPGTDAELLIVTYDLSAATSPESVPVEFSDLLGTPPVVVLAVVNDLIGTPPTEAPVEVAPTVTHGQINIINAPFLRGDVNGSGALSLLDGILYLYRRFDLQPPGTCDAAEDFNGDGEKTLIDAVNFFQFLFANGPAPPPPFPDCAAGTLIDQTLGCSNSGVCP